MSKKKDTRPTLALDFDGVLHSYRSGWQGARNIPDEPVLGSMFFVLRASHYFRIAIFSSRSRHWGGRKAIKQWLEGSLAIAGHTIDGRHALHRYPRLLEYDQEMVMEGYNTRSIAGMRHVARAFIRSELSFPLFKPAAHLTIDDRAWCFDGRFPLIDEIQAFKPWNRR